MKNKIMKGLFFAIIVFATQASCQSKNEPMPAEYARLPNLTAPISNGNYTIEKVLDGNYNGIFYDSSQNFYVIVGGDNEVAKLDSNGIKTFELQLDEKGNNSLPDLMTVSLPSHYIFGCAGVYDLSKNKPQLEKFHRIINPNNEMDEEEWKQKFNELYKASDVVIFGYQHANHYGKSPIYFRQNNNWVLLYETGHAIRTDAYLIKCKIDGKYIEDKYTKMCLLKDVEKNCFSDANNGELDPFADEKNANAYKYDYKQKIKLKTIAFDKYRMDEASGLILGKAVNKLTVGDSNILFKEIAIKNEDDKSKLCETYMYLFDIPTKMQTNNSVSFLFYKFPFSWSKMGDDNSDIYGKQEGMSAGEIEGENAGMYVIRKTKAQ